MAITDVLPARPLTFDEFQDLQQQDTFDAVMTADKPGDIDYLFLTLNDTEYTLHFTDEKGWHQCGTRDVSDDDHVQHHT